MSEIYFSTDVESDGPIPGPYSMFAFGSVPVLASGKILPGRSWNLKELPDADQHPSTMKFWKSDENYSTYLKLHQKQINPAEAMSQFHWWVSDLSKQHNAKPVFVAYPAGFDFMFILWYLNYFVGESVFSHSALDMKSTAWAWDNDRDFRRISKTYLLERWPSGHPHNHDPLDDAQQQAEIFAGMLRRKVLG